MKDIPPKVPSTDSGLHRRYNVSKVDGEDDKNAVYFVLRIDGFGDNKAHIRACQEAALEFCKNTDNSRLALELKSLVAYHRGILATREIAESV